MSVVRGLCVLALLAVAVLPTPAEAGNDEAPGREATGSLVLCEESG